MVGLNILICHYYYFFYPGLYQQLMENIGKNYKISKEFVDEYSVQEIVGMPCLSLEANGGPPVIPPSRRGHSFIRYKYNNIVKNCSESIQLPLLFFLSNCLLLVIIGYNTSIFVLLGQRPHTTHGGSMFSESSSKHDRIMSAPAAMHRAQSATSSRIKSASTVRSKRMARPTQRKTADLSTTIQTASKEDSFIKTRQAWNKK